MEIIRLFSSHLVKLLMCIATSETVFLFLSRSYRNALLRSTQLRRTDYCSLSSLTHHTTQMKHWLKAADVWGKKADAVLLPAQSDNDFISRKNLLIRDQTWFMKLQHYGSFANAAFPCSKCKEQRTELTWGNAWKTHTVYQVRQSHWLFAHWICFLTVKKARNKSETNIFKTG